MIIQYWNNKKPSQKRTRRIQNGIFGEIAFRWILARYDKHVIIALEAHDESAAA